MRVLNANITIDPVKGGGTAERTFQISRSLASKQVECGLVTIDLGLTKERYQSLGKVEVFPLTCMNKRFFIPRVSLSKLRRIVDSYDVVHLMGHWSVLNALLFKAVRSLRKPYVFCPAGALPIYGRSKHLKKIYNIVVGKSIVKKADACVAISTDEVNHFLDYGADAERIYHIPNGISPVDYQIKVEKSDINNNVLNKKPYILFIGRLNHIKGPDLLARAFCEVGDMLREYQLVYMGPDEGMQSQIEEIASSCQMKNRIHFLGYLGGQDKTRAIMSSELVVIPSRQEAMSIVVLEAGILGRPVLITDKCGFDDVATINGGMVVPDSVDGLKKGLEKMLMNKESLHVMGENLRVMVSENYTWDRMVDKYISLYQKILNRELY